MHLLESAARVLSCMAGVNFDGAASVADKEACGGTTSTATSTATKPAAKGARGNVHLPVFMSCFGCFFCTTTANYLIRPARESEALQLGTASIPLLLGGTIILPMFTAPLLGKLGRLPAARSSTLLFGVYAAVFFAIGISFTVFDWAMGLVSTSRVALQVAFFLLGDNASALSISFLFGLMPDLIGTGEFASKLYPLLSLACNLGQLTGSSVAACKILDTKGLIFLAVAFICGALQFSKYAARLVVSSDSVDAGGGAAGDANRPSLRAQTTATLGTYTPLRGTGQRGTEKARGLSDRQSGFRLILHNPFLRLICMYSFFHSFTSTSLYVSRAHLMASSHMSTAEQMQYSAMLSTTAAVFTITIQAFGAPRMIPYFGGGNVLQFVPVGATS